MPAEGGAPKRLTTSATLGATISQTGWGQQSRYGLGKYKPLVVFRSRMKSFNDFIGELFTSGSTRNYHSNFQCRAAVSFLFRPDDSKMAFNRVFREFRTWKHYRGGMADDIWIYDFKNGTTENLTNNPARISANVGTR